MRKSNNKRKSVFIHLSQTTKMPCPSWAIPVENCISGRQFAARTDKPFICRVCYANQGPCSWANSTDLHKQNLVAYLENPTQWVIEMSNKITFECNSLYFRWFAPGGDLQSIGMLESIVQVAKNCNRTMFWLPTMEANIVESYTGTIPGNLNIRVSSPVIDETPRPIAGVTRSMVSFKKSHTCMSYKYDGECYRCRQCWDKSVKLIAYPLHVAGHILPAKTAKDLNL